MVYLNESALNLLLYLLSKCPFKPSPEAFSSFSLLALQSLIFLLTISHMRGSSIELSESSTPITGGFGSVWRRPRGSTKISKISCWMAALTLDLMKHGGPIAARVTASRTKPNVEGSLWTSSCLDSVPLQLFLYSPGPWFPNEIQRLLSQSNTTTSFFPPYFSQFSHFWCPWCRSGLNLGMWHFAVIPGYICEWWLLIVLFGKFWKQQKMQ